MMKRSIGQFTRLTGLGLWLSLLACGAVNSAHAAVIEVPPGDGRLAKAIAHSSPGDRLHLLAGVHQGPVIIDKSLTLESDGTAIVDGAGMGRVISVSAPNTVIRNIEIRHSGARLDQMDAGIYIDDKGDNSLIENNTLSQNLFGIYVQGPKGAIVRNNQITGRDDLRVNERGNGVQLWNTPGTIIEGNDIKDGRDGIFVTTSKDNKFKNNIFRNVRFAVHYMYTNNSEISGNRSIGNDVGYALMFSHHLKIFNNVSLGDRDHGILLNYANGSTISENTVINGKDKCVFIYNSNKNVFQTNRFEGCKIGVHFTGGSADNTLTNNAFIANETQVKYVGTRWLEWSKDGLGNYWSDNPSFDLNGDGIADTAYRPNDLVDQLVWRAPLAKILMSSPAVHLLRWAQAQFPGLHPGGVIDSNPLMAIPKEIAGEVVSLRTTGAPNE